MESFLTEHNVLLALVCGLIAVLYGLYLASWVVKQPAGNEEMRGSVAPIAIGRSSITSTEAPRRASSCAMAQPTMPAPMTRTSRGTVTRSA